MSEPQIKEVLNKHRLNKGRPKGTSSNTKPRAAKCLKMSSQQDIDIIEFLLAKMDTDNRNTTEFNNQQPINSNTDNNKFIECNALNNPNPSTIQQPTNSQTDDTKSMT